MNVPGIVQSQLDGEQVAAQVPLGGEDALFVTPTRTLIYRADGLLSDESVEEYPHDAERIEISEGRRKSAVDLDYGIEGGAKFKVPSNRLYEALHPVLAGVLNAADVTAADETVKQTYQFSELTLVITSERVVKHVGAAVWDEDYEEYHFDDVTRLDVEEGSVSSQIIIESEGRPQRIKTPSDQTREVRERIERALLAYHDVSSYEAFAREHADAETDDADESDTPDDAADAGEERADPLAGGVDPIDANPPELDDDGAIVEDEASVTTDERAETGAGTANGTSTDDGAHSAGDANVDASESADPGKSADAGASTDAGVSASGSGSADASESADAGGSANTSAGGDAGTESDARASADAGSSADAGANADAGTHADADTHADAGANERAEHSGAEQSDAQAASSGRAQRSPETNAGTADAAGSDDASGATEERSTTTADGRDETVGTADAGTDGVTRTTGSADATEAASDSGFADSGFEPASSEMEADDTAAQLEALTEAVERQNELLAEQQRTLETLIDELSRGR